MRQVAAALILTDDGGLSMSRRSQKPRIAQERGLMITRHRCESRLIVLMMIGWGWTVESAAQTFPQHTAPRPSGLEAYRDHGRASYVSQATAACSS